MTKKNGNGNKTAEENRAVVTKSVDEHVAKKYESLTDDNKEFKAHKALFDDMVGDDKDDMRILMSDVPLQAKPLMVNLEVAEAATDPNRRISLARFWLNKMLVYNVAVNRGARDDAIAVGQSQAEDQAAQAGNKGLFG